MARGVATAVLSFDIASYLRPFLRLQNFFAASNKPRADTCGPSKLLGNLFKAGTVGPAFSGDFRLGLYFSLQHDVWSRTMKALFVLLCPTAAGNASDYW
jgi:hypothetical protein